MELTGKVAMVTGASGDIGHSIAVALATAGADIAGTYVANTEGSEKTSKAVQERGRRYRPFQLDQRDPASIERAVNEVASALAGSTSWSTTPPGTSASRSRTWSR